MIAAASFAVQLAAIVGYAAFAAFVIALLVRYGSGGRRL